MEITWNHKKEYSFSKHSRRRVKQNKEAIEKYKINAKMVDLGPTIQKN